MLKIIQIIAIVQGFFLITVLLSSLKIYRKPAVWLLIGSIISIILYVIADDNNNLFQSGADWFFFDSSLFVTFFVLFVKYYAAKIDKFRPWDFLYFVPNLLYFFIEVFESISPEEMMVVEIAEMCIELIFLGYLLKTIYLLFKTNTQKWFLYFAIPLILLMFLSFIDEILGWFTIENLLFPDKGILNTYYILLIAFLFYAISLKLIVAPKSILHIKDTPKYRTSGLNPELAGVYKNRIIRYMEVENRFLKSNFNISIMAEELKIPKQYISEVLNMHLNTNFQEFINSYRVNLFIEKLKSGEYGKYTLFGIAQEVGFNSKSTFNSVFKSHKGMTPSQFKKTLS